LSPIIILRSIFFIFLLIPESDVDQGEVVDGILHDVDLNEPTMGEKLVALSFLDENKFRSDKEQDSPAPTKPPSADSLVKIRYFGCMICYQWKGMRRHKN